MIYIHQHIGLGDFIICNGLIRSLIKNNLQYTLFCCKPNYLNSIKTMYKDLENMSIEYKNEFDVHNFLSTLNDDEKIILGHVAETDEYSWDELFYVSHNIPFINRWKNFKINRDLFRENNLFNKLNPENSKFALVHSVGSDGCNRIDYSKIDKELKIIEVSPENTDDIFDYLGLIYKAEQIHCIESCFNVLVDSLDDINCKIFYHKTFKVRRGLDSIYPNSKGICQHQHQLKKQWIII